MKQLPSSALEADAFEAVRHAVLVLDFKTDPPPAVTSIEGTGGSRDDPLPTSLARQPSPADFTT